MELQPKDLEAIRMSPSPSAPKPCARLTVTTVGGTDSVLVLLCALGAHRLRPSAESPRDFGLGGRRVSQAL